MAAVLSPSYRYKEPVVSSQRVFNFMGYARFAGIFSILLIVISLASLATRGLNFGLDFTGGTAIELAYEQAPDLGAIRTQLENNGFKGVSVVAYGAPTDIMVRIQSSEQGIAEKIQAILAADSPVTVKQSAFVGPQIGDELRDDGALGLLFALLMVMLYIAMRFQFKFSVGAVLALVHDVIITLGVFSVFQFDFDLTVLAAVLAVIGYSINDTIVVFDRIRENFRIVRDMSVPDIINYSTTQTLDRTLLTSGTTVIVLVALFFLGGPTVHYFALALLVGIGIGTYSSIFVASALLLVLKTTPQDLMPPKVEAEGADLDELP
jgi:preprotein translocase subunit SecF